VHLIESQLINLLHNPLSTMINNYGKIEILLPYISNILNNNTPGLEHLYMHIMCFMLAVGLGFTHGIFDNNSIPKKKMRDNYKKACISEFVEIWKIIKSKVNDFKNLSDDIKWSGEEMPDIINKIFSKTYGISVYRTATRGEGINKYAIFWPRWFNERMEGIEDKTLTKRTMRSKGRRILLRFQYFDTSDRRELYLEKIKKEYEEEIDKKREIGDKIEYEMFESYLLMLKQQEITSTSPNNLELSKTVNYSSIEKDNKNNDNDNNGIDIMVDNNYESQFITDIIDIMSDEEDFGLLVKEEYSPIEKDIINNDNYNDNYNNNIINNNNYESNIIINTMGYEEDKEPPTKKKKLRAMPVNKENNYTSVVEPRIIITEKDEETKVKLTRKRKRKN
jgi:hypothetical protein